MKISFNMYNYNLNNNFYKLSSVKSQNNKVLQEDIVSFKAHRSELKTYFKEGKMPSVKYGIYGEEITPENVSIEHLRPWMTQKKWLCNLALASMHENNKRGTQDLVRCTNTENIIQYLEQFRGIYINGEEGVFDGDKYIELLIPVFKKLGFDI